MGMFDEITCKMELPIEGLQGRVFQTKDTPMQSLDRYEIREDGTLWHQDYDIEDKSDPNATGLARLAGCMSAVNKRWAHALITREINFYGFKDDDNCIGWIEFKAVVFDGKVQRIELIENKS